MITILHRRVNSYVHFLNYTTGEVMSFDSDDGQHLLDKIDAPSRLCNEVDTEVIDFLSHSGHQINTRLFRSTLLDLGMEFMFPTIVNIEITRRCSLTCRHCYISSGELLSHSSFFDSCGAGDIKRLFNSMAGMGVFLVALTGGEPFLNKSMNLILREAVEAGLIIEVFSNLQFIPEWFKALEPESHKVGRIQTSVYSVSSEIHDAITSHRGSLNRTIDNLLFLKDRGYYVEVATPLLFDNFAYRHETEEYFARVGIPQSFAWPILDEYYSGSKGKSSLNISREALLEFCRENPDFLRKTDLSDITSPICAAARATFAVSASADVFPCSQYPRVVGNLRKADIQNIYESEAMREIAYCKLGDVGTNVLPYNFCIGNNYSETGHPFVQPRFIREMLSYYETQVMKGGERCEEDHACVEIS